MRMLSSISIHILLVEDHHDTAKVIQFHLKKSGYLVTTVKTGAQALEEARHKRYDLIVLDIGLPDVSGFEVLHQLRSESYEIPVLILTGQVEIEDRVRGLKLGADDYLIKPYDSRELLARVETIIKRNAPRQTGILHYEDLVVDLENRKVLRRDAELNLTPKEFSLLVFFLRHPSEILSRHRLAEEVWGLKFDPGTNVVDVSVSRLRKTINEGYEKQLISTVYGEGFVLKTIL
jgi:two-component system, OmpR family, copper resistance phosphate regulon response regulator CusR